MVAPHDHDDAGQRPNLWEELNRPRGDRRVALPPPQLTDPSPDGAEPDADVPSDAAPSPAAAAMAQLDPQHLLLVGAALFAVVAFFALRGLGGSTIDPMAQTTPDEVAAVVTTPERLAVVDETTVADPPATTENAQPMAMGLPAVLLDSAQSQVFRLYRTALGREPDRSGFAFWSDQVRSGVPLEQLAEEFLVSEEYQLQFGVETGWDNRAQQLLTNAFGPAADQAELDARRDRFRGIDGAALLLAISEADETLAVTGTLR